MTDWNAPIPLDEFIAINKRSIDEPLPEECPLPTRIGQVNVLCGPAIRLWGLLEDGAETYRASIMLVTEGGTPTINYTIGAAEESELARPVQDSECPSTMYHQTEGGLQFWRFLVEVSLQPYEQRVRYSINGENNAAHQFFIPAIDASMNVMAHSCNGFSYGTDTTDFKLSLWLDVLRKHATKQHYHVMLGGGDQIYNDALKKDCKTLEPWTSKKLSYQKRAVQCTPEMAADIDRFYLNSYLEWFGKGYYHGAQNNLQPLFPLAMAQIPSVNIWDDHDIIDGFGSYKSVTMNLSVFQNIGAVAYKYYMMFQHQVSPDEPIHTEDRSWVLSKQPGSCIKQKSHSIFMRLGREISLLGIDCRTERQIKLILSRSSYDEIFSRLEREITSAPETKHLLVMLGVPILYPRMVWIEKILASRVLKPLRALATRKVVATSFINDFDGLAELLDDLNDHWCALVHKKERNHLVMKLIQFGAKHGVRITILSGDVHLGCFGRIKTMPKTHIGAHLRASTKTAEESDALEYPERDPRLMFNVISSAIVNPAPPNPMASLLNARSHLHKFDNNTQEDMVPLFHINPDGTPRNLPKFLNKRNWSDLVLAKQSTLYKDNLGVSKYPNSVDLDDAKMEQFAGSPLYVKYPARSESLVTSIHFEAGTNDPEASTMAYEVLIPDLCEKYILEKAKVKHVNVK